MNLKHIILILTICLSTVYSFASHVLGGEITWECLGTGQHQFKLTVYRDCNGSDIINPNFELKVWNHPTIQTIDVNFQNRVDISPQCTEVAGGPNQLVCGNGSQAGNGLGANEQLTYLSDPITLNGIPPAEGWTFTWESFSRSWDLTNISTPSAYGITINATLFGYNNQDASACYDSSPQFGQQPFMITCSGDDFAYNSNAFDPNNDSLHFEFDQPLDQMTAGGTFEPGVNPVYVPFNAGFTFNSPTPTTAMDANNIPASLNPENGTVSFTSFTQGSFGIKLKISSFRDGQKISEITREFQNAVVVCAGDNNNAPVITPPFAGNTSFEQDFFAGDLVNFNFIAQDIELLQDGTLQNNTLEPSGVMFGNNFTDATTGCNAPPCATLDQAIPLVQTQGINTVFNWQTTCDHLKDADGNLLNEVPYYFVFKVTDNYCSVPKVSYATVKINLKNANVLPPTQIQCIDVLENDDAIITWAAIDNTSGGFSAFEIHTAQDGLIATINDPNITSFTHNASGTTLASKDYFIVIKSGCNGQVESTSETISSIYLDLNNPNNGTAVLQWNQPNATAMNGWSEYFYIYREYPAGTWTLLDSVPYNTTAYVDTIDVCETLINYEIRLPNEVGCEFTSNVIGDNLSDQIAPNPTDIIAVSYDTITDNMQINWNPSSSPDTYGYFIFAIDENGFPYIVDTVFGINNTTYFHNTNTANGAVSYTISAFDSCFTNTVPPTYQTSAKSDIETSNYLQLEFDICAKTVTLNWDGYNTWEDGVASYQVLYSVDGSTYDAGPILTSTEQTFTLDVIEGKNYCYLIKSVSNGGVSALSNKVCQFISKPTAPSVVYVQTATVNTDESITVRAHIDATINASHYVLERKDSGLGDFFQVATEDVITDPISFVDYNNLSSEQSHWYRVVAFDSCGASSTVSQVAKTIYLEVSSDELRMKNYLTWSLYEGFAGSIVGYRIYRGVGGNWQTTPIANIGPTNRVFEDDVTEFTDVEGEFCYRIEAIESTNSFGIAETAFSNVACANFTPLIYVPNAFIKGGYNDIFLPVISLHDFSEYSLKIYDRWGRMQYESTDHTIGWDGNLRNGKLAPEGVFVYVIQLKDTEGKEYIRRGHVTLLNSN